MKKRLQFYLNYYETLTSKKSLTTAEAARGTRAIAHSNSIFSARTPDSLNRDGTFCTTHDTKFIRQSASSKAAGTAALDVLFLVLLIPYIFHYYRLENGVQKLYEYYDKLNCR